ncbi:MAG: molybdopterin-binding protein, partial [Albidovulum sp.]|nr:molybdopterin-binding protein [Albidovulum sp.]
MDREFIPVRIAVLTVSDSRGLEEDRSGRLLQDLIEAAGHLVADRALVRDDQASISAQLSAWAENPGIDVVISTGGTG